VADDRRAGMLRVLAGWHRPRSTSTRIFADAVISYIHATGDEKFEREVGAEVLVETARLWRSLGHHDAEGRFRIDGVTGPDEVQRVRTTTSSPT